MDPAVSSRPALIPDGLEDCCTANVLPWFIWTTLMFYKQQKTSFGCRQTEHWTVLASAVYPLWLIKHSGITSYIFVTVFGHCNSKLAFIDVFHSVIYM